MINTPQDQKLLNLAIVIRRRAMDMYPTILKHQNDEVESAAYLAVAQARQACPCLRNDRPSYSPVAPVFAFNRLKRELVRSGLLPVRLKDGMPSTNWLGGGARLGTVSSTPVGPIMLDELNAAVAKLSTDQKVLLYTLWVEGATLDEIIKEADVCEATIRLRINTIMNTLLEYMQQ